MTQEDKLAINQSSAECRRLKMLIRDAQRGRDGARAAILTALYEENKREVNRIKWKNEQSHTINTICVQLEQVSDVIERYFKRSSLIGDVLNNGWRARR